VEGAFRLLDADLVLRILSFLNYRDLCSVAKVSRALKVLSW
jgi:hypothetical protein